MVAEVNKLVYNTLIHEGAIHIPNVGTLHLSRIAATMVSKNIVSPPRLTLQLSSNMSAKSIVDIITNVAGVDTTQADDIFSRWLDKVSKDDNIVIEGICILRGKSITPDESFIARLNTLNSEPLQLHKRSNIGRNLSIALASIILLLAASYTLYINYFDSSNSQPITPVTSDIETTSDNITIIIDTDNVELDIEEQIEEPYEEQGSGDVIEVVDWRLQDDIRHWVVVGSYSNMENAERAVAAIERKNPELQLSIFELGSMYAIAAFGSNNHAECEEFKRENSELFSQAWIHTPRIYRE